MVFQFMDWHTSDYLFSFHSSTKFEWVCFLSINNRLLFQTWIAGLSGMPKLKRSHLVLKVKKEDMVFQFMDWRTSDYLFSFHSSAKFEWVCFLSVNNQLLFQTWINGLWCYQGSKYQSSMVQFGWVISALTPAMTRPIPDTVLCMNSVGNQ